MRLLRQILKEEPLQLGLIALSFLIALCAMPFAGDRIPMQWGIHGQVNWYAPKPWGLFAMPVLFVLVMGVVLVLEHADKNRVSPDGEHLTSHGKAVRSIRFAVSLFLIGGFLVQIAASTGHQPDVMRLIPAAIGLLMAFMGNLFGKLKRNRYVGIRLPWTLNSDAVWRRTHRVSGYLWTGGGIIITIVSLFVPTRLGFPFVLLVILSVTIVSTLVAWSSARTEQRANPAI